MRLTPLQNEINKRILMSIDKVNIKPKTLFSMRDISIIYPNDIGIQQSLREFINVSKFRAVKYDRVKLQDHLPNIRISLYNAVKLRDALMEHLITMRKGACKDKIKNLNLIIDLINAKIELESKDFVEDVE